MLPLTGMFVGITIGMHACAYRDSLIAVTPLSSSSGAVDDAHFDRPIVAKDVADADDGDDREISSSKKPRYHTVGCGNLLSEANRQSESILRKVPRLRFDNETALDPKVKRINPYKTAETTRIFFEAVDPNLGATVIRRDANERHGGGPRFDVSLHRPEIDPVRWDLYKTGEYYEKHMTEHAIKVLKVWNVYVEGENAVMKFAPFSFPGRVVDVGMNIGWFTLLGAAMGRNVTSFDPNPKHHVRVCQSLLANGWYAYGDDGAENRPSSLRGGKGEKQDKNDIQLKHVAGAPFIETYQYGVANSSGHADLSFDITSMGSASLRDEAETRMETAIKVAKHRNNGQTAEAIANTMRRTRPHRTEILTLDNFAKEMGWLERDGRAVMTTVASNEDPANEKLVEVPLHPIALLKVDVEGYEEPVFEGARQLLQSQLVSFAFVEFKLTDNVRFRRAVHTLSDSGYRLVFAADWSGSFNAFMKKALNPAHGYPTDYNDPEYATELLQFVHKSLEEGMKWDSINTVWCRKDINHIKHMFNIF